MSALALFGRCKPRAVRVREKGEEEGKNGKLCIGRQYGKTMPWDSQLMKGRKEGVD